MKRLHQKIRIEGLLHKDAWKVSDRATIKSELRIII
jgi:hypothetical protein